MSGDVLTIRVNLTRKGSLEFFKNGISQGVAYTGFKSYGQIYFAMSLLSQWDQI
jgi:hypothetical protein